MGLLDRVLLLLLLSPMLLTAYMVAREALESAHHESTPVKKAARRLAAFAVAALALGFTLYLVIGGGGHWCTEANRDDPGCEHVGG
jgi:cation transporter-like permease